MRFHIAASLAVPALGAAGSAYAQQARIDDIQVSREGEAISILLKLSQQPSAASAKTDGENLIVEIDGVSLGQLNLDPPPGSLVRHVDAADRKITLSGAAFGKTSTVIYRNAVLIETRLAEPALRGSSLMTASPVSPKPVTAPVPKPVVAEGAPARNPAPIVSPPRAQPLIAEAPPPMKPPAPRALESAPVPGLVGAPAAPPAPKQLSTASLAQIDAARCVAAATDLSKDPWALAALGDHALCLIDSGKDGEAKTKLDQLAAFDPEDWRVVLGRAALAAEKGDASTAETGYRAAAMLAPDASVRAAITVRADQAAGR